MDVFEAIKKRRSVRRFLSIPVEWDKVAQIIDAARLAPSSGNLQDWKFIVVIDPDIKKKIAEACLQQHWMSSAPVHIVVCGDPKKVGRFYSERGEHMYSIQNCAAASQNILLAATGLGLGATWVGAFDEKKIRNILEIPEHIIPYTIIPIGYPDEFPKEQAKFTLENVVFFDKWGNRFKDIVELTREYSEYVKRALIKLKKIFEKAKGK